MTTTRLTLTGRRLLHAQIAAIALALGGSFTLLYGYLAHDYTLLTYPGHSSLAQCVASAVTVLSFYLAAVLQPDPASPPINAKANAHLALGRSAVT